MGSAPNSTAARPDGTYCSPQYTSAYVPKNGSAARTAASTRSVDSRRPCMAAMTSRPMPAAAKRTPAPSSGGVSSSPILIATHVLDQMATRRAYSDQTTGRLIDYATLAGHGRPAGRPGPPNRDTPEPMTDLDRAVLTVVRRCLNIRPDEDVVVVVDEPLQELGEKLRNAAQQSGAEAVLTVMSPRPTDGSEPPAPVAEALAACDVFMAPASRSLSHTLARKRASEAGARGATMPHVTTDMLARLMSVNFDRLKSRSHAIAELLDKGTEAKIACPRGTDLTLDLRGRHGIADDGDLTAPGAFGNLPCGEGFIAPANGSGTMYARSIAAIGLASGHPAKLTVTNGHLTDATEPEGEKLTSILKEHGENGTNLAELGVGTNDKATLTGNVLEDEKILGTIHVAFGASIAIGGTVSVPIHLDCVVTEASLSIDGTQVLDEGRFVLAA